MEYFWDNVHKVLVHQSKIREVFFQEDDSTLLDDGSNDIIKMQISYLIPFIKARSHASAMCVCVLTRSPVVRVFATTGYQPTGQCSPPT
jgi:hypothetical protein